MFEKHLRGKILLENSVSSNIKRMQIPDESIKELLVKSKKSYILNNAKALTGTQKKLWQFFLVSLDYEHNGGRNKSNA